MFNASRGVYSIPKESKYTAVFLSINNKTHSVPRMGQNSKFLFIYPLPTPLTPLPLIPFTTEEITGCTNEVAKGANKAQRNLPSCFFVLYFMVSVIPSINTPESSNDFMILTISFISSFEINKISSFPGLTAPFPLISLSNLFIAFEVKLLTNQGKLSLAKEITTFVSVFFFSKFANQELKDLPD